ncbi:MAG TPA: NAD(P)-dependent oxidoreductase [Alphaproteobacteria bacterium]|nr:NAD(P)-dependent oxidoreductase [Alphaproteobacteria bacterium]
MPDAAAMTALSRRRIGFIGLGLMGRPMALNLHGAGAAVTVHNRSRGPVEELAAEGLIPAASPRAAAEAADTVIVMVSDTPAVEAVLTGPDGVVEGLRPGALVVDMGTTEVPATRRFAERVAAAGGDYVDAPVSGGQVGAETAALTIMAGGSPAAFEQARPIFQALGRKITHVGDIGSGQIAKAANQLIVGLTIGAVAEALTLARIAGADPARVRDALEGGFAWSRIMELHGKRMIDRDFRPGGKAKTQLKDLRQAEALAQSFDLELPALRLNRTLYESLVDRGDGELDHSALIRLFGD